jgi:phospholipid/cholesterol/gamma-HCH transport system substrate-binding protein
MLRRQLERYGRWVVAILLLVGIGVASGAFILGQERFTSPFASRYQIHAEFDNATGVTAGLGQPVNVAGVRVGTVMGATLRNGAADVTLSIDPSKLPHVYDDASAVLAPNTPLMDMQVDLDPGRRSEPALADGATIPHSRTDVPPSYDDLTRTLDADTRDYFAALVQSAEKGLRGRGDDLRRAARTLGPTTAQARRIGDLLVARRVELARVIHNLGVLAHAAGGNDHELARVVGASDATLRAVSSQRDALSQALARLPGTLRLSTRTIGDVATLADATRPTLEALDPAIRRLPAGLRATNGLLGQSVPLVRASRPVLREAVPLDRDLAAVARGLRATSPDIRTAFKIINYAANELSYNPKGSDEGYLYWLAWASHDVDSVLSVEDAHGAAAHGLVLTSCSSLAAQPDLTPLVLLFTGQIPTCPAS